MFTSLFNLAGSSLGLGFGAQGACHLVVLPIGAVLPKDVEAGLIPDTDAVFAHDYGTHVGFSVVNADNETKGNEYVLHTYSDLVGFLKNVYATPVAVDDPELDEILEAMRDEAIAEADGVVDEDAEFIDEDEANEVDDSDTELDVDSDDDSEYGEDEEMEMVTLTKPSAKVGTKKYKAEMNEMVAGLQDLFGVELDEAEVESDTIYEILEAIFDAQSSLEIDPSKPIMDVFAEYVDFE